MKIWALAVAILIAAAHANTIPTQGTLVVATSGDEVTPVPDSSDVTTEEASAPIKLTDMLVHSEISLRYARTAVVTHVRNPARKSQQTTFHVLLPDTAFISGFVMTLDGKSYKAYVKGKEEAKKIYTEAVSQGLGAAHIATKARDSNHFTVTVNVEPNSKATFNLTYEELLVRRHGVYNIALNLMGGLVPRMEVTVHIKEYQKIKLLRVPEVRTGNEIDATENDAQNSGAVIQRSDDKKEATITFTPDLEEQKRLIRIYADKTKQSSSAPHYWYPNEEDQDNKKEDAIGQFVVQYDVERSNNGEIIMNDGYFVHFFAPQSLKPLSKYVVFVLDTSGSMSGRKIEQLRDAMKAILGDLNPTDYFSLIEFNSDVTVHQLKEADEEPAPRHTYFYSWRKESKPVELVPPSLASPENIAKAQVIVSRLIATGGTNIYDALKVAIDHVHKADSEKKTANESTTAVDDTTKEASSAGDLESIIIFVTDGDPTVGETSTSRIIAHMSENNSGEKKAVLYCLALGEDADRGFLLKLALRNLGFMRHIYEASDAGLQLRDFYRQVSSPLLSNVRFVYSPEQIKEASLTRHKYSTVNDGGEVIVAGELAPGANELAPTVEGFCADPDKHGRKRYVVKTTGTPVTGEYLPLERLWGYLTIKQLLDERETAEKTEDIEKRALAIALKYAFVTPLTSLVVVKPNATNAVNAESVDDNNQNKPSFGSYLMARPPLTASHGPAYPSAIAASLPGAGFPYASYSNSPQPLNFNAASDLQLEEEVIQETDIASLMSNRRLLPLSVSAGSMSNNRIMAAHHHHMSASLISAPRFPSLYAGGMAAHHYMPDSFPADRILGGSYRSDDYDFNLSPIETSSRPVYYSTTPVLYTTSLPPVEQYHLRNYNWALSLLNSDAGTLEFSDNGKNVSLELSKEYNPPRASSDVECSSAVSATDGSAPSVVVDHLCVYLTRCAAATNITVDVYSTTYCSVNDKYAGVCCPRDQIDLRSV